MFHRKVEAGFTILEVIIASAISATLVIAGLHYLNLEAISVARIKEKAKIRSVAQQLTRIIQSRYIIKHSAEADASLLRCVEAGDPNEPCTTTQSYREFALRNRSGFVYAGYTSGTTKFYKLPPISYIKHAALICFVCRLTFDIFR